MIGWLDGIVRLRDALTGTVIIDVQGCGYQLTVSWQTFGSVPEVGERCTLWVHTHVREGILALYGFSTPAERQMFLLLTSVPQVGPRNAISVLGGFPLQELVEAIAGGARTTLERVPGVGRRTAERILVDLADKVDRLQGMSTADAPDLPGTGDPPHQGQVLDEARAVLVNLGWKPKPVDQALEAAGPDITDLDALVRDALARLMAR